MQTNILTTILSADDEVITIASENSLQKLPHETASTYNLTNSIAKAKILALKGKEFERARVMINNNITEHVIDFNYLGRKLGSNRNYELQNTNILLFMRHN
jgi:hypothetical protein